MAVWQLKLVSLHVRSNKIRKSEGNVSWSERGVQSELANQSQTDEFLNSDCGIVLNNWQKFDERKQSEKRYVCPKMQLQPNTMALFSDESCIKMNAT